VPFNNGIRIENLPKLNQVCLALGNWLVWAGSHKRVKLKRVYFQKSEIALNRFIREHFPEWACRSIDEL